MKRKHRPTEKELIESIVNALEHIDNDLMEFRVACEKLTNELHMIEKNTEGLNYILLENQKKDEDQENSRG